MRFGSVCSGIESASVAWEPLGWKSAWFSEIEKFPSELLAQRYPGVKNLGDMRFIAEKIRRGSIEAPEIIVGGTPCQAFSVAGLRNSLDDSRGQLTLKFVELVNAVDEARAAIRLGASVIVWENVPGVLSAKGNAFGCFLAGLAGEDEPLEPPGEKWSDAGCVFGPHRAVAWRCLDAQYFGLAQRRKRVFVIASAREGFDPAKVLFEFDGVRRDSPPSREARQEVAGTLASHSSAGGFPGTDEAVSGYLQVVHGTQDPCVSDSVAFALGRNNGGENAVFAVRTAQTSSNGWGVNPDTAYTFDGANGQAVAFAENSRAEIRCYRHHRLCHCHRLREFAEA